MMLAGLVASTATGLLLHRAQAGRYTAERRRLLNAALARLDEPAARPALRLVASAGRRLDGVS